MRAISRLEVWHISRSCLASLQREILLLQTTFSPIQFWIFFGRHLLISNLFFNVSSLSLLFILDIFVPSWFGHIGQVRRRDDIVVVELDNVLKCGNFFIWSLLALPVIFVLPWILFRRQAPSRLRKGFWSLLARVLHYVDLLSIQFYHRALLAFLSRR